MFWIQTDGQDKYCYAVANTSLSKYNYTICDQCSRTIATPQYTSDIPHLELEGGGIFPDLLRYCGAGARLFLISEQALDLFEKYKVSGYMSYQPVYIEPYIKRGKRLSSPTYYSLSISGRIDLDLSLMHLKRKRKCSLCGQFDWNRMRIYPFILDQSSWDGSDLCLLTSFPGNKICSETIVEIVRNHSLTGFDFEPLRKTD